MATDHAVDEEGGSDAADSQRVRVSSLQRTLEQRVANPVLCRLLRSSLHGLACRWLLLVSYEGRRSGRRFTFPVSYSRVGSDLVAVTPRAESVWWTNFRTPHGCSVWYRGTERSAIGAVATGDDRDRLLAAYLADHWSMRRLLGVTVDDVTGPGPLPPAAASLAVVRFSLDG